MNSFERWEDGADGTLERLSRQWSGKTRFKPESPYIAETVGMAASVSKEPVPELKVEGDQSEFTLTRLSGQWSADMESVCDDRDEEAAPYLLVNWKVWCLKVSVLVLIPAFLVLGGGIKHISDFCPTLAEYCHSQTLTIRETVFGKNDLGAAQSHHSLARLYHKRHEEKRAMDHADYAAKIYVLDLLQRMSNRIVTYNDPQVIALEENLALAAEAADQLGYHTLASKYWRQVSILQPTGSSGLSLDRARSLLKERYQASNSLALAGQKSDAVMVLEGGFALLPREFRRAVFEGLQGKLSWKLSDDDLNSMKESDFALEPASLRLVFTGKEVMMEPSMSSESIESPFMKPHLNQEPDFKQFKEAVLKVSRSL
ncbi:hypothetical protein GC174_06380 [bacterium]|nr:hypothetical protein [bacterium]